MKILCIADLHIGVKSYSKIDPKTHFTYRELEALNNFKKIVDICIDSNIPVLLIAGDVYHTSISSPSLQDEVNKIIFYASENNISVLILDGNHDLKKLDTAVSALKPVNTFQLKNVIHTKDWLDTSLTINNETVRFVFLPTYTNNEQVKELLDLHLPAKSKPKNPTIVIGHFTTQGASLNDWLVAENEEYIDIKNFSNRGISFVVLGHLHKPQVLKKKSPMIFYTGSLQRVDFNEEEQEKGYWIINTQDKTANFFQVDMQKFYTVKCALTSNESFQKQLKKVIDKDKVENAIVRVLLDVTEESKLSDDDIKSINTYLTSLNANMILPIVQKLSNSTRLRNTELNESLSIDDSLKLYFKDKPREKERIKLGMEVIQQYKKNFS